MTEVTAGAYADACVTRVRDEPPGRLALLRPALRGPAVAPRRAVARVGMIVPRLGPLYDWSASELGLPAHRGLPADEGPTPAYAWDPQDADVWHPDVMHDNPVDTHTWMVGLDSWIIQDGNYPDIVTGQRIDFAPEFASRSGLRLMDEPQAKRVRWIAGSQYEVIAQVVKDDETRRRRGLAPIAKTDAWGDDSRMPSYLLRCRLEPAPRSAVRSLDEH